MSDTPRGGDARLGLIHALGAYLVWGLMPIYFKQLQSVAALEVVAHRIVWGALLLVLIQWARGRLHAVKAVFADRRQLLTMAATATLIAVNWLVYIWAIVNDHILAGSLGYFLNPLLNVFLGYLVFREPLGRAQMVAVGLAFAGVALLAMGALDTLWISLTLAFSFGIYSVIKKLTPIGPMAGLTVETLLWLPVAAGFLVWLSSNGDAAFNAQGMRIDALLVAGGAITALPLVLFASAARRLRLATLGLMQYLAPSMQFLIGAFVYSEPLGAAKLGAFALIWTGLAIYSYHSIREARREDAALAGETAAAEMRG